MIMWEDKGVATISHGSIKTKLFSPVPKTLKRSRSFHINLRNTVLQLVSLEGESQKY